MAPISAEEKFTMRDARKLLEETGALFVRWEMDFDQAKETPWWHVIKDKSEPLSELSKKTRYYIRRGLKVFSCGPLSKKEILGEGYQVYKSAFERYKTHENEMPQDAFVEAVGNLPEQTKFWGARNKDTGALVAFSENFVEGNVCFYNTMWFETSALRQNSSYALFYEMNRFYLEIEKVRYISDGARGLSHSTEIHSFLISKFRFRKAFAKLEVVYSPGLACAIYVAYPFRRLIKMVPFEAFSKASILLKQEEIRRECSGNSL